MSNDYRSDSHYKYLCCNDILSISLRPNVTKKPVLTICTLVYFCWIWCTQSCRQSSYFVKMKWFTVVVVSTILSLPFAFWYSLPISWRRWFVGIKKLLTLLILVRLHSFRIKIWNYSFIDDFEASVDASPERDLFIEVESGRHISMQEVEGLANQVARYLVSEGGVKQKDTVALMMTNRFELVAVWLGVGKAGCSCALLNTNARGLTLEHALQVSSAESHSKLFVIERELHCQLLSEQLVALTDKGVNILIWEDLFLILSNLSQMRPSKSLRNAVIERDVLLYIFTSGTTGLPKASKISHSRVWIGSLPLAVLCDLQPGERVYTTLPLYHSAGGLLGVGACIRYKGCMVLRKKFSAKNFASDCHKYRCAVFQYIGELCRYLCATPPQPLDGQLSLRCAFGNGLRPEIWEQFQHKYRIKHIVEFFLATEANVGMFNCFDRVGALGYIPRWADLLYPVFLVKPDPENKEIPLRGSINNGSNRVSSSISDKGFCQVCPANEPGLVISSINEKRFDRRFDGYSDEKASKKKVLTDVFRVGDRYFNTGDLMTRDADGYFFWSDRAGDTYRWKGEVSK